MRNYLITILVVLMVAGIALLAYQPGEPRYIPLEGAHATFGQAGLHFVEGEVDSAMLSRIADLARAGPPRAVLCTGADIGVAMASSETGFALPEMLSRAVAAGNEEKMWMAVYLGSDGSSPSAYRVRAIEVRDRNIRLVYEHFEAAQRTSDLRAYMIWAPLGHLEAGSYTVELFDNFADSVTWSRAWEVTAK